MTVSKQLFNLWPWFSTCGWAILSASHKLGFWSHDLKRRQWKCRRAFQYIVSFYSEHAQRWGQHSLSFMFFLPKSPAAQTSLVNNETDLSSLFSHAGKCMCHKRPDREGLNTSVMICCLSWSSLLLTDVSLVHCVIKWKCEHVKFLTAGNWLVIIKDAYHTIIMTTETGMPQSVKEFWRGEKKLWLQLAMIRYLQTAVIVLNVKHLCEISVLFSDFPPSQSCTGSSLDESHLCFGWVGSCPSLLVDCTDFWCRRPASWLGLGHHFLMCIIV